MTTFLSEILECITSDYSIVKRVEEILNLYGIDEDKFSPIFQERIKKIDPTKIDSLKSYVETVVFDIIKTNDCKRTKVTLDFLPLVRDLKEKQFEGSIEDLWMIQLIEDHAVNEFHVTKEAMKTLNHKIVDWLVLNNKKTYSDFVYYLETSHTLRKVNIPYDHLKERAKKLASEIIDDIDYLEKHRGCVV